MMLFNKETDPDVLKVSQLTGWRHSKARKNMDSALEAGVSYRQYILKSAFELSHEEIIVLGKELKKSKKVKKKSADFFVRAASSKSGISEQILSPQMKAAKKMGISYYKFVVHKCWNKSTEEMQNTADLISEKASLKTRNREYFMNKIMQATGWSRGKTELEYLKAYNLTECSPEDYCDFRFYELTPEEQSGFVTLGIFQKFRTIYNDTASSDILNMKPMFNRRFSRFITRKWTVSTDLSWEDFAAFVHGLPAIIVKPVDAAIGRDIKKISLEGADDSRIKEIYETLVSGESSIIEEYILQHNEMMEFSSESVNTVRVATLNYNGRCIFIYAVMRMGRGLAVDNFHAGGIAAAIDTETGVLVTDAADLDANTYPVHPVSGKKIKGFSIPHWNQVKEICSQIYNMVDGVNLIGWDFAITPDGVELIEGNFRASYAVAQIPYVSQKKGLKSIMVDPYIK